MYWTLKALTSYFTQALKLGCIFSTSVLSVQTNHALSSVATGGWGQPRRTVQDQPGCPFGRHHTETNGLARVLPYLAQGMLGSSAVFQTHFGMVGGGDHRACSATWK